MFVCRTLRQSRSVRQWTRTLRLCRASELRVKVARQNRRCDMALKLSWVEYIRASAIGHSKCNAFSDWSETFAEWKVRVVWKGVYLFKENVFYRFANLLRIYEMATRNISYGSVSSMQKGAEASESGNKETHSVSKRCERRNEKFTSMDLNLNSIRHRITHSLDHLFVGSPGQRSGRSSPPNIFRLRFAPLKLNRTNPNPT